MLKNQILLFLIFVSSSLFSLGLSDQAERRKDFERLIEKCTRNSDLLEPNSENAAQCLESAFHLSGVKPITESEKRALTSILLQRAFEFCKNNHIPTKNGDSVGSCLDRLFGTL